MAAALFPFSAMVFSGDSVTLKLASVLWYVYPSHVCPSNQALAGHWGLQGA